MRKNKCDGATGMHKILSLLGGEVTQGKCNSYTIVCFMVLLNQLL